MQLSWLQMPHNPCLAELMSRHASLAALAVAKTAADGARITQPMTIAKDATIHLLGHHHATVEVARA